MREGGSCGYSRPEPLPASRAESGSTMRPSQDAVSRAERGQVDADLGGGVIKQRVARPRAGRSGGFRTVIAYRTREMSVFLYGFAKNERDNISSDELKDLRKAARFYLSLSHEDLSTAVSADKLVEIDDA
jgi:hypothetical protein